MFRTFGTALAAPAALSLLIVACSGSGDKTDDTARDIRSEELARMVLDLGQFGPEVAGFVSEDGSGPLSLEQTAEEEDDPESEKADLQQFGWVAAHKGSFEAPQSVEGQAGGVGSTVYLFATADGASRYFSDSVSEVEARSYQEGVKGFKKSDLDLGHDSARFDIEVTVPRDDRSTVAFWATVAAFRRGRLVGVVQMHAINASELEKTRLGGMAGALASTMNDRMGSVLAAASTAAPAAVGQ